VTYPKQVAAGPIPALVGESFLPVFSGKPRTRGPIYWEHEGNKAVRNGNWKLVSKFPDQWELFDMEADRTELHDLAASQPERVNSMRAMWDAWAKRIGGSAVANASNTSRRAFREAQHPPYLEKYRHTEQ
jgi:arylsulfatase A-like enzyme